MVRRRALGATPGASATFDIDLTMVESDEEDQPLGDNAFSVSSDFDDTSDGCSSGLPSPIFGSFPLTVGRVWHAPSTMLQVPAASHGTNFIHRAQSIQKIAASSSRDSSTSQRGMISSVEIDSTAGATGRTSAELEYDRHYSQITGIPPKFLADVYAGEKRKREYDIVCPPDVVVIDDDE